MAPDKIAAILALKLQNPQEPVYVVSTSDLLSVIVKRLGEHSLSLTAQDLQEARDEVQAAFGHYLDQHEYINMGLDAWELARQEAH